ncbi:hypothetical protein Psi02_06890 [Planotetraspora silvatica]|uniref:Uncharacterized protein n=2 Tax=Planotetraspora silvatica TaxID=234614 RepID=A0A8J3UTC4_9ACTN|nr:hypothetical protein [Planotetraspora silvatica]GII44265.1 hypothetical protein Psi02_06890 [Planotetraspora silvatica]
MRSLVWMKDAGADYAEVDFAEGLAATGTAVCADHLDGALDCDAGGLVIDYPGPARAVR